MEKTMRKIFLVQVSLLVLLGSLNCSSNTNSVAKEKSSNVTQGAKSDVIPNEYLVMVSDVNRVNDVKKIFAKYGKANFELITKDVVKVAFKKDPGLDSVKKITKEYKWIRAVEPNRVVKITGGM